MLDIYLQFAYLKPRTIPFKKVHPARKESCGDISRMYRHVKSEITAELLFDTWNVPSYYNIADLIKAKWRKYVHPLIKHGLDPKVANSERLQMIHDG